MSIPLTDGSGSAGSEPEIDLTQEMHGSFLSYAMSVIISRALPDARDGLKPVHRRILFAMKEGGYDAGKPYRKSARIVGDVMGQYHPHGDSSIYDAMARMAQDFSMRMPLIDGQGNFGSVDGDPPAAMRYTEARLERSAEALLADIDKETVDFGPNYDGSLQEPSVLPTRLPNLLINGVSGIAVGMASNIAPHNPIEVVNAAIALAQDPTIDLDALIEIIPGPDFPTGASICGKAAIRQAYATGRGSLTVRGLAIIETVKARKSTSEKVVIAITELPYQVNKARLAEKIGELADAGDEGGIVGISDVRDESDRTGMRLVVELKKDADANAVLNALYRMTDLQTTFGTNMVAIDWSSGGPRPEQMGLKRLLEIFVAHRRQVIRRRSLFELKRARQKLHLQAGLLAALDMIDVVIATIRAARDQPEARAGLMALRFPNTGLLAEIVGLDPEANFADDMVALDEIQAKAILDMRLARLTGLEREEVAAEARELAGEINGLLLVLNEALRANDVLVEELVAVRDGLRAQLKPRRTRIEEALAEVDDLSLIPREDMLVTLTASGYIKRVPLSAFRTQGRGGRGKMGAKASDNEPVQLSLQATTHARLLVFTAKGMVYAIPVYKLPAGEPRDKGRPIVNFCEYLKGEEISAVLVREEDAEASDNLMFVTSSGTVRRNAAADFARVNANGKIAMKFDGDDAETRLVAVLPAGPEDDVLVATAKGYAIRFPIDDVRVFASRDSVGVRGINLGRGDRVVGAAILPHSDATPEEREAWSLNGAEEAEDDGEASANRQRLMDILASMSDIRKQDLTATERVILTVTAGGYGKRTSSHAYRTQGRGGSGVRAAKVGVETGPLVAALPVPAEDDVMITTARGVVMRLKAESIRLTGRVARGTRLITLDTGDTIHNVMRLDGAKDEGADAASPSDTPDEA